MVGGRLKQSLCDITKVFLLLTQAKNNTSQPRPLNQTGCNSERKVTHSGSNLTRRTRISRETNWTLQSPTQRQNVIHNVNHESQADEDCKKVAVCRCHTGFPLGPSSPGRPRPPAGPDVPGCPASPFSPRSPRGPCQRHQFIHPCCGPRSRGIHLWQCGYSPSCRALRRFQGVPTHQVLPAEKI